MSQTEHLKQPPGPLHEESDVDPRPLMAYAVGLFVMLGVTMLAMWIMFNYLAGQETREGPPVSPLAGARQPPPVPHLQTMDTQGEDLKEERAKEEKVLNSYDWVDRGAGVVRIPLDKAILAVLEKKKLPAWEKAPVKK